MSDVFKEIATERELHRAKWSADHDDGYSKGQLAVGAACYAAGSDLRRPRDHRGLTWGWYSLQDMEMLWPWPGEEGKLTKHDRRKQLLIAAAMCIAEIERLDRAES